MSSSRPNLVLFDPEAFSRNLRRLRAALPEGVAIFQVCKGDGYGLGLENAVRMGLRNGVDRFCVGDPEEALAARALAPDAQILLFPCVLPDALKAIVRSGITVTVHNRASLETVLEMGIEAGFFFKVETGLSRYGFREDEWAPALEAYRASGRHNCRGVYTHFGAGMREELDASLDRFDRFLAAADASIPHPFVTMAASSHTATQRPSLPYGAVDPGRFLYGMLPASETGGLLSEPVVTAIQSRLLQVSTAREEQDVRVGYGDLLRLARGGRLGVFPMGTYDGLPARPPFGHVLIRGEVAPVIGRTLQHSIVDLSALADAQEGDLVALVGSQGERSLSVFEMAVHLETSVTEIHFGLIQRLTKIP